MNKEEILKKVYIDNPKFKKAVFNRDSVFEVIKETREDERKKINEIYENLILGEYSPEQLLAFAKFRNDLLEVEK